MKKKKKFAVYTGISDNMSFAAGNVGIGLAKHMTVEYDYIVFHMGLSEANREAFLKIPHCQLREAAFSEDFLDYMYANMPPGRFRSKEALMCFSHFEGFRLLSEYEYAIWLDDDVLVREDLSDMPKLFGTFALANDDPWNVADQFVDKEAPAPYDGGKSGFRVSIMLLHDTLPYQKIYPWMYEKAREHAYHLKNPEQAIFNMAIQEFSLPVKEIPLAYHADCREPEARTAKVVHFGTAEKVWNTPWISKEWPEWLYNHHWWENLGGTTSRDFSLALARRARLGFQPQILPVAVYMQGGIGDAIIQKRKMDEVLKWDPRIVIDLYTEKKWEAFLHHFYDGQDNRIKAFLFGGEELYHRQKRNYAIGFHFTNTVDVEIDFNEKYLLDFPQLLYRVHKIKNQCSKYGRIHDNNMALHFARCNKDGLDCYTSLNRYDGFCVDDYHTHIPMLEEYKVRCQKLNLPEKYITINGSYTRHGDEVDCKAWPVTYFRKFIRLFREKFPDIGIVQVSGKGFSPLPGCESHVIGADLELVKYVLQGALLHLDCESGMVHLASQLDTKCVVLFGPTPLSYYGYDVNINIQSGRCHDCCWYTKQLWRCYRGMKEPECMYGIAPEYVLGEIGKYLAGS